MREHLVLFVLVTFAALVLLPLRSYGLQMGNDGWLLHPVMRMLDGEILYRDVLTYYAPLRYHVLHAAFAWLGPSFLLSRTLELLMLLASVALAFRLALRLVPLWLAWLPAAVYALAPGPWTKAPYALCTVLFFVVLARALERPGGWRNVALGLATGFSLAMRHELGIAQLGIAVVAAAIPALFPGHFGRAGPAKPRLALREAAAVAGVAVASVAPLVAYYALHDALGPMRHMMFAIGFGQMPDSSGLLLKLLSPTSFGVTPEGRAAGLILMAPLPVYAASGVVLLFRLQREGMGARNVLLGAILAFGIATLPQAYSMMRVIRLLQSGLPFYLLSAFLAFELSRMSASRIARVGFPGLALAAGCGLVWVVNWGIPVLKPGDEFAGSMRMLRFREPTQILGHDTVYVGLHRAEEIRLVRAFLKRHAKPGEPVLALPLLTSYYALLDHPNPTRIVAESPRSGDYVLSQAQKEREMQRLLESDARYVIASRYWLASADRPDHLLATLFRAFHPVRNYGSVAILERGIDETTRRFWYTYRRMEARRPVPADAEILRQVIRADPEGPLALELLASMLTSEGELDEAVTALRRAAELDPDAVVDLQRLARILIASGRHEEARDALMQADRVRESPASSALWSQLPASLR